MRESKDLQDRWKALSLRHTHIHKLAEAHWSELEQAYSQKHRHYHNFAHLRHMFKNMLLVEHLLEDKDMVHFAVFYHDMVYDPSRQDNEEQSAAIARRHLSELGVSPSRVERCGRHISATKGHEASIDSDTNCFLDLDLAILGEEPDAYSAYVGNIRKEYASFSTEAYHAGRSMVIKHFLEKDFIFHTEIFRGQKEVQARRNLEEELSTLQ